MTRLLTLAMCGLCSALAMLPGTAAASGGSSIADAPTLVYGQVTAGGGMKQEFWRLPLYSGDKVTFLANLEARPELGVPGWGFSLYGPSTTDYTINSEGAADDAIPPAAKDRFYLTSPFTGLGTLDVCEGGLLTSEPCGLLKTQEYIISAAEPYSFTATVTHATSLEISAPTLAQSGSSVTVRASVQSPAGIPQGNCLIQGAVVPLTAGRCAKHIRLGHGRKQRIGVAFVPNDGWQAASGHRTVRLLP